MESADQPRADISPALGGHIYGYNESMSVVYTQRWTITSPNMTTIPFFPVDRVSVRLRSDGRFGDEDITLNPQVYCKDYPHRVLVRHRPGEHSAISVMWWTPAPTNFQKVGKSSYSSLGRLCSSKLTPIDTLTWDLRNRAYHMIAIEPHADWSPLEALISNMRYGVMRLKHSPYTYREMIMDVAQTQRLYLEALALCKYMEGHWQSRLQSLGPISVAAHGEYLGAWTKDASIVQRLQHAGIPVYFVQPVLAPRSCKIFERGCTPTRDDLIVTSDLGVPERYGGPPNDHMHRAFSELNCYGDLEKFFYDLDVQGSLQPVGQRRDLVVTSTRRRKISDKKGFGQKYAGSSNTRSTSAAPAVRDKWVEITGDYIPTTVPHWSKALRSVNPLDRQRNPAPKEYTGYRFPDPGLLVFSDIRREKNLFNWLLIRDASIRRIMHDVGSGDGIPRGFSNELWRIILGVEFTDADKHAASSSMHPSSSDQLPNCRSAPHADRRRAAIAIFGQPPDGHNHQEVIWRGHVVPWGTFFKHDPLLVEEILWDIHQNSFQYDLITLDRYLCPELWHRESGARQDLICGILGCDNCFVIVDVHNYNTGVACEDEQRRMKAYQCLHKLMEAWPSASPQLGYISTPGGYKDAIASRFCRAFCKAFGRPPILPKMVPQRSNKHGIFAYRR
ncbi:hypothetical protein HWV62_21076 [Athelia sp. TMB]|nr:hypothetical protein HWV62_21076 [Athelia sp. TMB]